MEPAIEGNSLYRLWTALDFGTDGQGGQGGGIMSGVLYKAAEMSFDARTPSYAEFFTM